MIYRFLRALMGGAYWDAQAEIVDLSSDLVAVREELDLERAKVNRLRQANAKLVMEKSTLQTRVGMLEDELREARAELASFPVEAASPFLVLPAKPDSGLSADSADVADEGSAEERILARLESMNRPGRTVCKRWEI